MELYDHQIEAVKSMKNGCILYGGVGSGKSRTSLTYYFFKIAKGRIPINGKGTYEPPKENVRLYIITTARKRDTHDWEQECLPFLLEDVVIDSWNNIEKYQDVEDAFFIFDEQRVVGYGKWSKTFIKISKKNQWILLSATPGDTWMDYVPVFIANGFYKNKTEFIREHVIFSRFSKYPKIDRYINTDKLENYKKDLLIDMNFLRKTISHQEYIKCDYDKKLYFKVLTERWNPFTNEPVKDAGEVCRLLRLIVNSDPSRVDKVHELYLRKSKLIVFYNYNFELEMLKEMCKDYGIPVYEWNGHKHELIPDSNEWLYLVQYTAGAEGWNCIQTDTILFFSQNYSYKIMVQAAGRIDRLNTPFKHLYYIYLTSDSTIDKSIANAVERKKVFNEKSFLEKT